LTGTIGFGVSVVLGAAVGVAAGCPTGITIGVAGELSFPLLPLVSLLPLLMISFGGQPKSVGGQFVFSLPDVLPKLGLPMLVTSLVFELLLLLSALAAPAEASATTAATSPITATRQPLLIG
jgi:hypothetical protein